MTLLNVARDVIRIVRKAVQCASLIAPYRSSCQFRCVVFTIFAFAAPGAFAQIQGSCSPSKGGSTSCGTTAPASMSTVPVSTGAGNPINIITGNKYQQETDMPALPGVLGLEIIRHYNSAYSTPNMPRGILGRGWRLSYETDLHVTGNTIQIIQADGMRIIFTKDSNNPSVCASPNPTYGQIHIQQTAQGNTYQWRWPNGKKLDFNADGKLVQIVAPTGEFVSLQYDHKNWLMSVRDPQGRVLRFNYVDPKSAQKGDRYSGLQSIDSPVGRFSYSYGSDLPKGATIDKIHLLANLVKVSIPTHYDANQLAHPYANRGVSSSSISRTYHYEDANHPTLLTGISVTGQGSDKQLINQRISTYGYDINGNAILSMKANGAEKVTLDHSEGGKTILTNSLGQKTTYKHTIIAGEYRLLEAIGPGCTSCSPGNRRYSYDKLGQLIEETTLNHSGKPLQTTKTERDKDGRPIKISHIAYKDGKPQAATWQRRYGYEGSNTEPSLIAQPSVVAGQEAVIKISYNSQSQPTSITQSGWSPAIDGKAATPISRTTTYRYSTDTNVNTKSDKIGELSVYDDTQPANRWMEINGPLPSQTTRIEYDAKTGLVVKTITPGNHITEVLERNSALRPSKIRNSDGVRVVETAIGYSYTGQTESITQQAFFLATSTPILTRSTQFAYDVFGNISNTTKSDGLSKKTDITHIEHDALLRPISWHQPTGTVLLQAQWGEIGTAAQNHIIKLETTHKQAERRFDDFGRVIAIKNPDQGWQTATYDAVDRIIATTDARSARQVIRYNAQGYPEQIERWSNLATTNKAESITQIRYAGQQPIDETITDTQGTRRTQTQYDALGREINVIQTITLKGRTPVTFTQAYTYDDQGRRSNIQLNDQHGTSSTIHNNYDNAGRIAQITTQGWLPNWLGGQKMLVRAIQWQKKLNHDIATSLTHGNGKVDSWPQKEQEPVASTSSPLPQATTTNLALPSPRAGSQHDAAGLPHQLTINAKTWNLHWDAAGRLQEIQQTQQPQGNHATYLYDARGRRVAKMIQNGKTEPTITYFAYDGVQLRGEADAEGNLTHSYAYLGYRPVAQIDHSNQGNNNWWSRIKAKLFGATIHHLHTDQVGQVTAMSDAKQGVLPKAHQPLRYIGQYYDVETGLHYHGARFYEPGSGKFLSPDPAGISDALNDVPPELLLDTYAYAGGNPQMFFDPDGAARIRYFAIDDGKKVAADLQPNQGHWAFAIWDIRGFENNLFAYDKGGSFLGAGQNSRLFQGTNIASTTLNDLRNFYTNQSGFYSPDQFELDMSDINASAIIKEMTGVSLGPGITGTCPYPNALLPSINLGVQGTLTPTSTNTTDPNRLIMCEAGLSANDVLLRRIQKAIEIHEVKAATKAATDKDCSSDKYLGCAANTWNPSVQPGTNTVQPASYGWTQFTPLALVDAVRGLSASDLTTLGITAQQQSDLAKKVAGIGTWYVKLVKNGDGVPTATAVAAGWAGNQADFVKDTGLTKIDYDRMVSFGEIALTLKKINEKYKKSPTSCKESDAKCFWSHWEQDDPTAKAALLKKAKDELGATQTNLNPYIRDPKQAGEGRAGFQWTVIAASPIGQILLTALSDKAKADLLVKSFLNQKMKQARSNLKLTGKNNLSAAQELNLATEILHLQNGSKKYPPKVLPHFKTTFCVAGSARSTNGYLRMNPLKVQP